MKRVANVNIMFYKASTLNNIFLLLFIQGAVYLHAKIITIPLDEVTWYETVTQRESSTKLTTLVDTS